VSGSVTILVDGPAVEAPPAFAGDDHPMRKVTRQVAFDGAWDRERAAKVATLFDSMAAGWTVDHDHPARLAPLRDALDRGDVPRGRCVEVGSGTGIGTRVLADAGIGPVMAVDLAFEMVRHAPPSPGFRVQGDGAALPVADRSVVSVVLVNALLFPHEVDRVLAPAGAVVWVNTMGAATPIHLRADEVVAALPGVWAATASCAGTGTGVVLRRG